MAFFNDDEEEDEEDSFKPITKKPLPTIGYKAQPVQQVQSKPAPTQANTQSKFSKLFEDDDEDEDY